jgi:hypothetical protein
MSGVGGQGRKTWGLVRAGESEANDYTAHVFRPQGLALTARGRRPPKTDTYEAQPQAVPYLRAKDRHPSGPRLVSRLPGSEGAR